ncbi:hypothetical protein Pelo_1886 [Pelomyxa schiedti]|nr:hypothetical protein Pelo_1886 [Pelomyxa schiedti]
MPMLAIRMLFSVWKLELKGTGCRVTSVALHNNVLFAGIYGHLFAINPVVGTILWHVKPTGHARSSGMAIDFMSDKLIVGSEGYVSCISCIDGHELWTTSLPRTKYLEVNMILQDDAIYVGSFSRVFALRTDGSVMWSTDLGLFRHTSPVTLSWVTGSTEENSRLVGCNGYLYTVRPSTGEILMETSLPNIGFHVVTLLVAGIPQSLHHSVYISTNASLLRCDAVTHEILWQTPLRIRGW